MLEALKVIILGIVEGITEWLPISSTGHLILVEEFVKLNFSQSYLDMFNVVIQLGAIMAVVVIYFHRLNPFSPKKTEKQKRMTLQLWVKVVIASIPAGVVGVLFNDFIEEKFNNSYVVATMLIVVGYCDREQTQRKETSDHQDFPDGSSGPDLDRSIPDACYDSGNFPFRSNDRRSTGTGRVKNCSSGFYILSGDSGNGRCQPCKTSSLWI